MDVGDATTTICSQQPLIKTKHQRRQALFHQHSLLSNGPQLKVHSKIPGRTRLFWFVLVDAPFVQLTYRDVWAPALEKMDLKATTMMRRRELMVLNRYRKVTRSEFVYQYEVHRLWKRHKLQKENLA